MEPRTQYAQTKDGVSIAFYTLGEGTELARLLPNYRSLRTKLRQFGANIPL